MATTKQANMIAGRVVEFQDKFQSLTNDDSQYMIQKTGEAIDLWLEAVKNRKKDENQKKNNPSILQLISGGQTITIKALDGSRLIYNAKDTFKSGIDNDFDYKNDVYVKWGVNNPGIATVKTPVQVHEVVQDGTFIDIFSALPGTWAQSWLSQDQVIEFCKKFAGWLRQEGGATVFLIKKDENKPIDENNPQDNLVVVYVRVLSDGLDVLVRRLESVHIWHGGCRHRVVAPQLIPSVA